MESLSGGEKTMAALAFVFAIAQVVRPSLLILDEVDAFLDADNVEEICKFLQKKLNLFSQGANKPTQALVVSHKEELCSQMDSLIGVCTLPKSVTS